MQGVKESMNLGQRLRSAVAKLLAADNHASVVQTEAARRVAEHNREVARAKFEKAEKKFKRAKRQKQLKDLGLTN